MSQFHKAERKKGKLRFLAALVSHYVSPFPVVQNIFLQHGFCCNHSRPIIITSRPFNFTISRPLCHSREGGNPVFSLTSWIPVHPGMTYSVEIQSSHFVATSSGECSFTGSISKLLNPAALHQRRLLPITLDGLYRSKAISVIGKMILRLIYKRMKKRFCRS